MNFSTRLLPLLLAALTLPVSQLVFPGCATVTQGPTQHIRVATNPPRATIYLNGRMIGQTPTTIVVNRFFNPHIRIEMPGFQPFDLKLEKELSYNGTIGNFFLFYTPIVIDAATGSLFEFKVPDKRRDDVVLRPWDREEQAADKRGVLFIGVELTPVSAGRKIGQLQRR